MSKKKVNFMCTAFRDGFQSVYGARVLTADFLPALQAACDAGMDYFEAGGGARYQSLYFYCNEDAFDMMDAFRAINELVFAVLFVVAVGLGPFAGVMALFVHTTGVLAKLFSEAVEATVDALCELKRRSGIGLAVAIGRTLAESIYDGDLTRANLHPARRERLLARWG